jgi:hypothetical protein
MKFRSLLFLVPVALACYTSDSRERSLVAPGAVMSFNDPSRVDTVGSVDLIVDPKSTENHWRVKEEKIGAVCSAIEGGVTPGTRRLLRFTVTTPNIGDADNFIGNPREHFAANDGLFELDTCHGHFHFKNYATYKLIAEKDINNPKAVPWRSAKRGFCMLDTDPYLASLRDAPRNYWSCGTQTIDGFQGISKGWNDTYIWFLGGQYFVLDGGDGQKAVPAGRYYIVVEVNPAYAPDKQGNCPRVKDPATGLCHQFAESNYANNTTAVLVYIAESGPSGPEKNSKDPTEADNIEGKDM